MSRRTSLQCPRGRRSAMPFRVLSILLLCGIAVAPICASGQTAALSEIRIDQPGSDNDEYFELTGTPGASLDGLSYLVIGDGAAAQVSGVVEAVVDLAGQTIGASGTFVAAEATFTLAVADLVADLNFENSDNVTHLLVRDFTGAAGDDLDTDDDGTLDVVPWSEEVSCVALVESVGSGELTYCATSNGPDGTFVPGHSFLCAEGWRTGAFDPAGGDDTPGAANACAPSVALSEIRIDQPGGDDDEYFELAGDAGAALDGLSYLVIGDGAAAAGSGVIEAVVDLSGQAVDAAGFFVAAEPTFTLGVANLETSLNFENSDNVTHLVVSGFVGANGDDLDVDDDGVLDATPWDELVDCVSLVETVGSGEQVYCTASVGPDGTFVPGHSFDCPEGFVVGEFDPAAGDDTPGAANACALPSVVINEIDYDQPGTDGAEFIELRNNGAAAVDLDPFALQLVNGSGGGAAVYATIDLPAASLAPGEFFVVCGNASTTANCDLDVSPDSNLIQNGAPDAVALIAGGSILDVVSYEGDVPGFVEGSGIGLEDDGSGGVGGINENLGISRTPDGFDSDQNATDFSPRCITPGTANSAASDNCAAPGPPVLVINEIDYDQPGSDAAEFIEIKNTGIASASLDGVAIELVNGSGGSVYRTIALPAVALPGGDYFVVCGDAATTANCDLDVSPDSNLIQNGEPDAARLVFDGTVLDAVSYEGEVPGAVEGTGAVADAGTTGEDNKGISRTPDGADSDDNSVDFAFVCITPGNANTDRTDGCTNSGPVFEIFEIQGAGTASPLVGQTVRTLDNIVTAVDTDGFYIQTPPERVDGDDQTSDGIFIFTDGAPTVAVGDRVDVAGEVEEFFDLTELTGAVSVTVASSGNPLPAAVVLDAATPSPLPQPIPDLERFEGMLVSFEGTATGPSDRFGDVAVVVGSERAFREPGIEFPGMAGLPEWDGNPEVFEIDPDGLGGADAAVFAGQAVTAEGPLTFSFGDYQVLPTTLLLGTEPALPRAVRAREPGELTIASQNMLRFFDDQDDPGMSEPVLTAAEFQDLLGKFSLHVRDVLDAPDVLAVQEVENLNVLEQLAIQIAADGGPAYSSFLVEGNDVGGIDVGFMTRDDRVMVQSTTQFLADLTLSVDGSLLHDRPPLVLDAVFQGDGATFPFSVMVVHNRSLSGIDDPSSGPRVRQKRLEQAETIAALVQSIQTTDPDLPLVVTGDFNAFQFSDGFVDAVGVIRGNPGEALLPGQDLVDPDLSNAIEGLDPAEQYSFIFGGNAQVLDHALVSAAAAPSVSGVEYARGNVDAPNALMDDATTPLRVSDHDGLVLFLAAVLDSDGDGVEDDADLCADTTIPESVPTVRLLPFRYALTDGDTTFDTRSFPHFPFQPPTFTTEDTGGCSCEQILDSLNFGGFQRKFGCGLFLMKFWVRHVVD